VAVLTRPNRVQPGPPYPHYDVDGIWDFFLTGLRDLHGAHRVDAISVTTHGASAALLGPDGGLAAPVLDYEHPGPDDLAAAYDRLRPDFAQTGSARMRAGLNVGAQVHWQLARDPGLRDRVAHVTSYPGYFVARLTGRVGYDLTSLGCHTDLWNPWEGRFSPLVDALGLTGRMAPPVRSADVAGAVLAVLAGATGLASDTFVTSGIHDSNASLYPHLLTRTGAFSVVSTGTWVVCMAVGGGQVRLDPARDTLVNVNALGAPTPSAKFMGGRAYETLMAGHAVEWTSADVAEVLARGVMYLPEVHPGSGPWPDRVGGWLGSEPAGGKRAVAVGQYLAMMTATCLDLIGADGPTVVEGPFARNNAYMAMLASATRRVAEASASKTGTAIGAALLAAPGAAGRAVTRAFAPDPVLAEHFRRWQAAVN
jgi:sugar (pentulose or hexulose) kinase